MKEREGKGEGRERGRGERGGGGIGNVGESGWLVKAPCNLWIPALEKIKPSQPHNEE